MLALHFLLLLHIKSIQLANQGVAFIVILVSADHLSKPTFNIIF